ncbi:MAG TPA: dihydrodipicolinate synthase family protein [Devosia sp.]|nr:dihydrodipicolinate synthase family protein [Devosia sp.]
MKTAPITFGHLAASVIAVPPLAQTPDLGLARAPNVALIDHLQAAGVRSLMYGGNANFYNIPVSAYAKTLEFLAENTAEECWVIPAVGPDFGRMVDQAPIVRDLKFPMAMALPAAKGSYTEAGMATALRRLSDSTGAPILMYAKHDGCLDPALIGKLVDDGVVAFIKYAVVRDDPKVDNFLRALTAAVDPRRIISGIGERPVVDHFTTFGLTSFTSGAISIAPRLSMAILHALQAGGLTRAAELRDQFIAIEDCRDTFGPARVLHDAVTLAGVADMGPLSPLQSNLVGKERDRTAAAARELLSLERAAA